MFKESLIKLFSVPAKIYKERVDAKEKLLKLEQENLAQFGIQKAKEKERERAERLLEAASDDLVTH